MQKYRKQFFIRTVVAVLLMFCVTASVFAQDVSIAENSTMTITCKGQSLSCSPIRSYKQIGTRSADSTRDASITTLWDEATSTLTIKALNAISYKTGIIFKTTHYARNTTNTVTLTNPQTSGVVLKISYVAAGLDDGNGTFSETEGTHKTLLPGASLSFAVTSKATNDETKSKHEGSGTVQITQITVVQNPKVSFASSSRGDYTYQINSGTAVTVAKSAVTSADISVAMNSKVTLTHGTPDKGYTFYGWMGNDTLLGTTDGSYTIQEDMIIYPVYLKTEEMTHTDGAPFTVNGQDYMIWQPAITACLATGKPVVINREYTLPSALEDAGLCAGYTKASYVSGTEGNINYTIPNGATLLVPYNDDHTVIKGDAEKYVKDAYADKNSTRTLYRQLTMASGANIIVANGGHLSVGSQCANQFLGQIGDYGKISMNAGSSITVQNGGYLYAWGYIAQTAPNNGATVTVQSGGTVYEPLATMDYPGSSTLTSNIKDADVFPMRAYFVRNVEVPMTLQHGAKEYVFYHLWGNNVGSHPGYVLMFGHAVDGNNNTPAFQFGNGTSITKSYVNGIQNIVVNGDVTLNAMTVTVDAVAIIQIPVKFSTSETTGFVLPSRYDVTVASGTFTMNDNLIVVEGVKVTIAHGATVNTNGKNLYVTAKAHDVGAVNGTNGCSIKTQDVHNYQPRLDQDAVIDVNGTLKGGSAFYTSYSDTNPGNPEIISSEGTGVIEIVGVPAVKNDVGVKDANNSVQYIDYQNAQLKNADGTYTAAAAGENRYCLTHGVWYVGECAQCNAGCEHSYTSEETTQASCTDAGVRTYTCSKCGDSYTEEIAALGHAYNAVVTDPTCTTEGYTTHTCARCSHSYTDSTVAALDHKYVETTTVAPTCTEPGSATCVCSVCGDTYEKELPATGTHHAWEQVTEENKTVVRCSVCDAVFQIQASMVVDDSLDLIFHVRKSDVAGLEDDLVCTVTKAFADGRGDVTEDYYFNADGMEQKDDYYRFRFSDISAKEMTDSIMAVISFTAAEGGAQIVSCTTSVQDYAYSAYTYHADKTLMAEEKKTAMFTALADMLNYGAACQTHFGYAAENLANAGDGVAALMTYATPTTENAVSTVDEAANEVDSYYYGTSFSAKNKLMFTYYYDFGGAYTPDQLTVSVTLQDANGDVIDSIGGTQISWYERQTGSVTLHGVDITGIPLSKGDIRITCILKAGTETISNVVDGLAEYAARAESKQPGSTLSLTMQSLLRFTESAKGYFSIKGGTQ